MVTKEIPIEKIKMNENRWEAETKGDIYNLAKSLEAHGLINAITVRAGAVNNDFFEIVAGRRRLEAAKYLGWETIRADVYDWNELTIAKMDEVALAENVNREEMSPLDEGELFKNLLERGTPLSEMERRYNRKKSAIYQRIQLTTLAPEWKDAFRKNMLSMNAAAKLASFSIEKQSEVFNRLPDYCKNGTYRIDETSINNHLAAACERQINKHFHCDKCDECQKRTHHNDKELFPELYSRDDFCLDETCYNKTWKKILQETVNETQPAPATPIVTTKSNRHVFPSDTFVNLTDGDGVQIGENRHALYDPDDDVVVFQKNEAIPPEVAEKAFDAVLMGYDREKCRAVACNVKAVRNSDFPTKYNFNEGSDSNGNPSRFIRQSELLFREFVSESEAEKAADKWGFDVHVLLKKRLFARIAIKAADGAIGLNDLDMKKFIGTEDDIAILDGEARNKLSTAFWSKKFVYMRHTADSTTSAVALRCIAVIIFSHLISEHLWTFDFMRMLSEKNLSQELECLEQHGLSDHYDEIDLQIDCEKIMRDWLENIDETTNEYTDEEDEYDETDESEDADGADEV